VSLVSTSFLLFLAIALICYFSTPQKARWCVLLAASYCFYWILGGLFAVSIISFTILTVYASGLWAGALREKKAARSMRRAPLALCLTLNIGLLAFFKFSDVIIPSLGLLLIPGVSFYTFQASGYLIDVYTGKVVKPERNLLKLALFLSFFPQLVQGPISRHGEIAADLFAGHGWDWDRARSGVQRIIWGLFMKLIVANYAAAVVNPVYSTYWEYGGAVIVFSVLMYCIQIYADFSGGINIALGAAVIVGVKLPENFFQPFFANSLADFWRRWHITLGKWFRDYLFYPLALSSLLAKVGKQARKLFGIRAGKMLAPCIATFCVFFAIGVWHGSGLHILLFGFLNGIIISASLYLEPVYEKLRLITRINGSTKGFGRVFAALRTLAVLVFLRYFVRAGSLASALYMLRRTLYHPRLYELWDGTLMGFGLDGMDYLVFSIGTAVILTRDFITESGRKCSQLINSSKPVIQFALLLAAIISIVVFGYYSNNADLSDFIYAQY